MKYRVSNGSVVADLAAKTYRANRKRNLLTIFAIFLTTLLITVVLGIGISYYQAVALRQLRSQGMDYDVELSEPRPDQVETARSLEQITSAGLMVKCAIVEKCGDLELDKLQLYWLDETCWEQQCIPALEFYEGSYPQEKNEIMLSTWVLSSLGIDDPQVGMPLTLTYYVLAEGTEQSNTFTEEFVLSGYYRDYTDLSRGYVSQPFYQFTGANQTDNTQGKLKIKLKNSLYTNKDLIQIQQQLDLKNQFLGGDTDAIQTFFKTLLVLAALFLMILVSGYLFIYNTLYISIARDIRYYGQLKTMGTTSRQLRSLVYRVMIRNAFWGILSGLAAGYSLSGLIIPRILSMVAYTISQTALASPPLWICVPAAAVAFFTNWLGSRQPARMAGECSPIEAMRYTGLSAKSAKRPDGTTSKSVKSPAGTTSQSAKRPAGAASQSSKSPAGQALKSNKGRTGARRRETGPRSGAGIPAMARREMFRSRKQAAVILLSFITAVTLVLVVFVVVRQNSASVILNAIRNEDLQILNSQQLEGRSDITREKTEQIRQIDGVSQVRVITSAGIVMPYQEEVFGDYFQSLYSGRYAFGNYEEELALFQEHPEYGYFAPRIVGIDREGFDLINESLGNILDWETFERGETAVAGEMATTLITGEDGEAALGQFRREITGKEVHFFTPEGTDPQKEWTVTVAGVLDGMNSPNFYVGGYAPGLYVSQTYMEQLFPENSIEKLFVVYDKPYSQETEQQVRAVFAGDKTVSFDSKIDSYLEKQDSENQVKLLGGCLAFLIALLAVLNYCNMMAAGVQDRAREFAALESIGMTRRQTVQMLALEGLGYALLSLAASMVISLPMGYGVFQALNTYYVNYYAYPWAQSLVLALLITALCASVPVLLYRLTWKDSLVDRLRESE